MGGPLRARHGFAGECVGSGCHCSGRRVEQDSRPPRSSSGALAALDILGFRRDQDCDGLPWGLVRRSWRGPFMAHLTAAPSPCLLSGPLTVR